MLWIKNSLDFLALGWVGSVIGIAGLLIAIFLYILPRQRTQFAYLSKGNRLLGLTGKGLPEGITAQYHGVVIPRLTRTLVIFWNAGEKTISNEDIASTDLLRLRLVSARRTHP